MPCTASKDFPSGGAEAGCDFLEWKPLNCTQAVKTEMAMGASGRDTYNSQSSDKHVTPGESPYA